VGVLLACGVGTACGGESVRYGDGDGGTGGSEAGGSDSGGSANGGKGGTANGGKGGTANGGSSSGVGGASGVGATPGTGGGISGSSGSAGTAGAGGEPSACFLNPDPGPCLASMPRYAFDGSTGLCLPFIYGGCDGNANNFETIESCYATCIGPGHSEAAACMTSLECTLIPSRCCGPCGEATLQNMVAVNTSHTTVVQAQPSCAVIDCVPCDPPSSNPWLGATCHEGRCVAFDARQTELTACAEHADCRLRGGLGCCENCAASPEEFVALNRSANTEPLLCGGVPILCDACTPAIPPGFSAFCTNGRCQTGWLPE
jgi:hypothetical protein